MIKCMLKMLKDAEMLKDVNFENEKKKKIMLEMLNLGKLMDNRKLRRTFWYLGNLFVGKKWICEDINIWNTINWDNN